MKINSLVSIGLCCLLSAASFSHETTTVEVSLPELIKTYTDEHEAIIVYKPSLNRTVKVVEEEPVAALDQDAGASLAQAEDVARVVDDERTEGGPRGLEGPEELLEHVPGVGRRSGRTKHELGRQGLDRGPLEALEHTRPVIRRAVGRGDHVVEVERVASGPSDGRRSRSLVGRADPLRTVCCLYILRPISA